MFVQNDVVSFFTSESVTEGHPDKICDLIADSILDAILKQDSESRVACEVFISKKMLVIGGEITTKAKINIIKIIKQILNEIKYSFFSSWFNCDSCVILNNINIQSPDIAASVDIGGAGDQGLMIGFACRETSEFMPLPIILAHKLAMRLTETRKKEILPYLEPDGKTQITVEYINNKPKRIDTVVLSTQHNESILDKTGKRITKKSKTEIFDNIIFPVIGKLIDEKTNIYINPSGKFLIGGPVADTGLTGRKIIVDTYGGIVAHGGGSFSGKDPTKVDRSASYMARHIAKNIVAADFADKCTVQLVYAIGIANPVSVMIDIHNSNKVSRTLLEQVVKNIFPLRPSEIIRYLKLKRPIFSKTSVYGHFGRYDKDFTWEAINKVDELKLEYKKI
ncbi:MAG: methionine adenosyltransferase [Endomicrobium sp.]|jgi:S-adenosylmethionine synthetase|nr:methionine adenosyltransferase [Endomicrobium sp.]